MGPVIRFLAILIACAALRAQAVVPVPYIYTEAARYDSAATSMPASAFPPEPRSNW